MPNNVVTIGKITDTQAATIAEAGLEVKEHVDLESMDIQEPGYGETFSSHAEPDEVTIFVELHDATVDLEKRTRELFADTMSQVGQKVRESDISKPLHELFAEGEIKMEFASEEEGEEFFLLSQRRAFLHAMLHWRLGERAGMHAYRFGMRRPGGGDPRLRVYRMQDRRW